MDGYQVVHWQLSPARWRRWLQVHNPRQRTRREGDIRMVHSKLPRDRNPLISEPFQDLVQPTGQSGNVRLFTIVLCCGVDQNRYMNCAVVTIGRGSSRIRRALSGPRIFVANVGNGCSTVGGTDVVFPEPGSDIQYNGDSSKRSNPVGTCNGRTYTGGGATGANGGITPGTGAGGGGGENTYDSDPSGGGVGCSPC